MAARLYGVFQLAFLALIVCLSACREPPNTTRDFQGFLKLHHLAQTNDVAGAQALFKEEKANANVQDLDGVTPLHRVARDGNLEMAQLLLDHYGLVVAQFGEVKGTVLMRKLAACYSQGRPGARAFRKAIAGMSAPGEFAAAVAELLPT